MVVSLLHNTILQINPFCVTKILLQDSIYLDDTRKRRKTVRQ